MKLKSFVSHFKNKINSQEKLEIKKLELKKYDLKVEDLLNMEVNLNKKFKKFEEI